ASHLDSGEQGGAARGGGHPGRVRGVGSRGVDARGGRGATVVVGAGRAVAPGRPVRRAGPTDTGPRARSGGGSGRRAIAGRGARIPGVALAGRRRPTSRGDMAPPAFSTAP